MVESKFIFVTGGVLSSLGKGVAAASIGTLLESHGYSVMFQKLDPYLNVDPGTMSPYQHGEVYVTEDGTETDLDMGHYERFTSAKITKRCNYTSGRIYEKVIQKERKGEYGGKTVQIIPHVTDEIKRSILQLDGTADIIIIELGGTVGDIEGLPFLEAVRQLRNEVEDTALIHLTLVPYIESAGEIKTKPAQKSVRELLSLGISPDFIMCRSSIHITSETKRKIALFCNVKEQMVISASDVDNIYKVPIKFREESLDIHLLRKINLDIGDAEFVHEFMSHWYRYLEDVDIAKGALSKVRIGIVGKYVDNKDAYKSIEEALFHAASVNHINLEIIYIDSDWYKGGKFYPLINSNCQGILVPGGFGTRGIKGKMTAIRYARENNIPFFGICLGMQLAVIEFLQNELGMVNATSEEFKPGSDALHIFHLMKEWFDHRSGKIETRDESSNIGGTMRLGAYPTKLHQSITSLSYKLYGTTEIFERHRHRFEFNNYFRKEMEEAGMVVSGVSPDDELVEIVELDNHPWFIGCQFHPEFKSNPMKPHPLFDGFVKAAKNNKPIPY